MTRESARAGSNAVQTKMRRLVALWLCVAIGAGLPPPHLVVADIDDATLNVALVGTMDTIWPRSEPFVVADDAAFVPAINPTTEQGMGIAVVDITRPDALSNVMVSGVLAYGPSSPGWARSPSRPKTRP